MRKVELLAPVGSIESLYAAVENKADAVYLGGQMFSARKHAKNFNNDELKEAVKYAHLRGVKVHVAVNILLADEEISEALDYIKFLYEIDVDALIIQDIGLASLVIELFPDLEIHASTQMTINNLEGAKYLEEMGFKRVVLARETPIDEIIRIKENTNVDIEVFVHGALCVSYSGQCLMSSLIGGRSGNRGSCAQPCRMKYSIVDKDFRELDGWEEKYVLSTKDLNAIYNIDELIEAGVDSFKIEGRMKRPEYVATIVTKYRKAINCGVESLNERDHEYIKQIFNRDFTKGLTFKDFGNSFISYDRPDNRGVYLGDVVAVYKDEISVTLREDLEEDDGIEFRLSNGKFKGMKSNLKAKKGDTVNFYKLGYIEKGSKVYKTSSSILLKIAKDSYRNNSIEKSIFMETKIKLNEKPYLKVTLDDYTVEVENDFKVEEARKSALDKETICAQYSKLGDTIFYIEDIKIELDDNCFLPLSVLNELRRDAIEQLEQMIINFNNREIINNYEEKKSNLLKFEKNRNIESKKQNDVIVRVSTLKQFEDLSLDYVDILYVTNNLYTQEILNRLKNEDIKTYLWTDKILFKEHFKNLKNLIDKNLDVIDGVSVSNLGSLYFIKNNFKDLNIHLDIGLNVFNSYTTRYFLEEADLITLSTELTSKQIDKIKRNISDDLAIITYGYLPSMIMLTCPMALVKKCNYKMDCSNCNFKTGYGLKDRMNKVFLLNRENGITTLYNSDVLMVVDSLKEIIKNNNIDIRLDFTIEDENINDIVKVYYDYLNNNIGRETVNEFIQDFKEKTDVTNGHYFRGII